MKNDPGSPVQPGKGRPPQVGKKAVPGQISIGTQIRELRKASDMTIAELADRIGKSVGYVSQIERNISAVSVPTLRQISDALEIQIGWFFQGNAVAPQVERDFLVRREGRRRLRYTGMGLTEELLSPNLSGSFNLILSTFEPGANSGEPHGHNKCEEAGLILSGTLELWIGDRHFVLDEGDSFTFSSSVLHRCHNPGDVVTVVIWVVAPPSY